MITRKKIKLVPQVHALSHKSISLPIVKTLGQEFELLPIDIFGQLSLYGTSLLTKH